MFSAAIFSRIRFTLKCDGLVVKIASTSNRSITYERIYVYVTCICLHTVYVIYVYIFVSKSSLKPPNEHYYNRINEEYCSTCIMYRDQRSNKYLHDIYMLLCWHDILLIITQKLKHSIKLSWCIFWRIFLRIYFTAGMVEWIQHSLHSLQLEFVHWSDEKCSRLNSFVLFNFSLHSFLCIV